MTESNRPRRRIPKGIWLYLAPTGMAISAIGAFIGQDDVMVITYVLYGVAYALFAVITRVGRPKPHRTLSTVTYIFLAAAILVTFSTYNRHVASVLNQVLPHAQLEVKQSWNVSRGDKTATQNGMTFRLFEVTLMSRWARGVWANVYDFEFESDGATYDNSFVPEYRGCDLQKVPKNGTLTCLIALEVPQSATGGTLVFSSNTYKAWADVSF